MFRLSKSQTSSPTMHCITASGPSDRRLRFLRGTTFLFLELRRAGALDEHSDTVRFVVHGDGVDGDCVDSSSFVKLARDMGDRTDTEDDVDFEPSEERSSSMNTLFVLLTNAAISIAISKLMLISE